MNTSATANFTKFTGRFGTTASQTLPLTGLIIGESYTAAFDLYIIDSWDGNSVAATPDFFNVSVNGTQLFHHSLSNSTAPQSFPDDPNVGRIDLGFSTDADAIYRNLEVNFTASTTTVGITFQGQNLESLANESWGIDNVSVKRTADLAPAIVERTTLPASNSSTAVVLVGYSISANRDLLGSSATSAANFSLREAGANGLFGDADDAVIVLTPAHNGGKTITFSLSNSPLQAGLYRFETAPGLLDKNGNAVTPFVRDFTIINPPVGRIENTNNNSLTGATPLPMTETPAGQAFFTAFGIGSIQTLSDVDNWGFNAEAGDRITVRLEANDVGVYPQLYVQNSSDQTVAAVGGDYSGVALIQDYTLTSPGTFYVRVFSNNKAAQYQLRVDQSRGPQLEVEGNDSQGAANILRSLPVTYQALVAGSFPTQDTSGDYFRIGTLNVGNAINVSLTLPDGSSLQPSDVTLSVQVEGNNSALASSTTGALNHIVAADGVYLRAPSKPN